MVEVITMAKAAVRDMPNAERMAWGWREAVPVLFIALIVTSGLWAGLVPGFGTDAYVSGALAVLLQTAATVSVCVAYRDMLGRAWRAYKSRLWLKILISAGCVAVMYVILGAARKLPLVTDAMTAAAGGSEDGTQTAAWFTVFVALVPLQAPFLEEVLFRHNLFFRFRKKAVFAILMCVVSAVLFGAVHLNNFGGNFPLTIPYMFIGVFLNGVYFFTKNIWCTLVPHIIFNAIGGILPALFLLVLSAFGVGVG